MTERYSVVMNSDSQEDGYLLLDSQIADRHIAAVFEPAFEDLARRIAGMLNAEEQTEYGFYRAHKLDIGEEPLTVEQWREANIQGAKP